MRSTAELEVLEQAAAAAAAGEQQCPNDVALELEQLQVGPGAYWACGWRQQALQAACMHSAGCRLGCN
jgi:hypothetical protein